MPSRPNLKQGSLGPNVRILQALLNKSTKPVPPLDVDGQFGEETRFAVMKFQKSRKLHVDGVAGPRTWSALEHADTAPAMPQLPTPGGKVVITSLVERAVGIALAENGVRENPLGSNRGPRVDLYNLSSGAGVGALWCMSFVYWCFEQAAQQTGDENPMLKTAYCPSLLKWAKEKDRLVEKPQRGDIFLVKGLRDGKASVIHTGIVTGGSIETVEGNTNNDGSSNGIGVFTRQRKPATCYFVRLS